MKYVFHCLRDTHSHNYLESGVKSFAIKKEHIITHLILHEPILKLLLVQTLLQNVLLYENCSNFS